MSKATENKEANVEVNVETLKASQKEKGTENIKYSASVTGAPVDYTALQAMCEASADLQQAILIAIRAEARAKCIGRLSSLDRAEQELFGTIEFIELLTTSNKKLTAASMVNRLESEIAELASDMQEAVMSTDFAKAQEIAEAMKAKTVTLEGWKVKREAERVAKVETRNANKDK